MKIGKEFKFDAGHHLPNYQGKCNRPHGHTWKVTVTKRGTVEESSGMVMDFNDLNDLVKPIIEELDHAYLNAIVPNPTCENIASYIADRLGGEFSVRVQEGEGGWAEMEE